MFLHLLVCKKHPSDGVEAQSISQGSWKYHELLPRWDCSGPAPTFAPLNSIYSTPRVLSTMPEKTLFCCPDISCWKKFTSGSWQLKLIKLHHPKHLQTAHQENVTIFSTPQLVVPPHHHTFQGNNASVKYFDQFSHLVYGETIADSGSQSLPSPLLRMESYPSTDAPLSNSIAVQWKCATQGCPGMNEEINHYYPSVTSQVCRYILCRNKKNCVNKYNDNVLKEENTPVDFPGFKSWNSIQKLLERMPDDQALGE